MMIDLIALDDTTQRLIETLHRRGNYSFFQRINGDDKCSYWRKTGKRIEFPADIIENCNFYFGVNPVTMKVTDEDRKKYPKIKDDRIATFVGPKNSTIAALNCLYAEFDGKDWTSPTDEDIERIFQSLRANPDKAGADDATLRLEARGKAKEAAYATDPAYFKAQALQHVKSLLTQPSVTIDSGGGYQGYWLLDDTFVISGDADRERAASLQKRWVMFVCGDPSVHDLRRILRVPGSRNHKKRYAPDYPLIDFIKRDFDLRYSLTELEALLPPEEPRQAQARSNGAYHTNGEGSFIDMFNASNSIADVLLAHGYTWAGKDRMNRPGSEDSKGVVIYADDNESYHHSGGDPLHNGYRIKPFNVVCKLDYNDDAKAAVKALTKDKPVAKDTKTITVTEYKRKIDLDDDEPLDDGLTVIVNGEKRKIKGCKGVVGGEFVYTVEKESDPVPESRLQVEVPDKPNADPWVEAVRNLGHKFSLNQLENRVEIDGEYMDDVAASRIYLYMHRHHKAPKTYVDDCFNVLAAENAHHPIQNYLNNLQWDGQNHLMRLLNHITGDGAEIHYSNGDRPLYAAIITRWLLGCVARGLDGDKHTAFKHQTPMLVLIGPQGMGKSSLIRWLCSGIGIEYHREGMLDPHHQDHIRSAVTKWIWEISELGASLRKGDRDALKSFITQEWHTYRKPWGRGNITMPLRCNFVGTINPEIGFLDDPTGNRRFLPINISGINHDYKDKIDVNQLWAQLVHLYKNGESPELLPEEKEALQATYTEHEVENPLQTYLQMYFTIDPSNENLECFTADIITRLQAFGVAIANNPKVAGREINDALAPLGGIRKKLSIRGVKGWGWRGIEPNDKKPPYKDTAQPHSAPVPSKSDDAYAAAQGI